jgi:hypothetical protein
MAEADIAALRLIGQQNGQAINHVFGFTALTPSASRINLATDFNTNILTTFLVGKSNALVFSGIQVDDVVPGDGARVEYTVSPAKAGNDSTSEPMPPKDALVITWNTLTKGRSYRGRTFETGRTEAGQNNGVWVASTLTLAAAFATAMLARYGPTGAYADWRFGIISRYLDGVKRPVPVWTGVTGFAVRSTVYSQRRRTIGQGS